MILTPDQMIKGVLELLNKSVEHISEERREEVKAEILTSFSASMFQGSKEKNT